MSMLSLTLPAPLPGVRLVSFSGEEGISRLFRFDLELESPDAALDADAVAAQLLGKPVSFGVRLDDHRQEWNGIVWAVRQPTSQHNLILEVVPALALLRLSADCRPFVGKTIRQIIEAGLAPFAEVSYEIDLHETYPAWPLRVQYRETALSFLC